MCECNGPHQLLERLHRFLWARRRASTAHPARRRCESHDFWIISRRRLQVGARARSNERPLRIHGFDCGIHKFGVVAIAQYVSFLLGAPPQPAASFTGFLQISTLGARKSARKFASPSRARRYGPSSREPQRPPCACLPRGSLPCHYSQWTKALASSFSSPRRRHARCRKPARGAKVGASILDEMRMRAPPDGRSRALTAACACAALTPGSRSLPSPGAESRPLHAPGVPGDDLLQPDGG